MSLMMMLPVTSSSKHLEQSTKLNSLHIVTTHTEDVGVQLTAHKVH